MVLLWCCYGFVMVLLGGCYDGYVVARWLLGVARCCYGVARWLLWCCYGVAMLLLGIAMVLLGGCLVLL